MPRTKVVLYQEEDGFCPFLEWFSGLPVKAQDKCFLRLERLRDVGHELRRPEADYLRDGIYEPRVSLRGLTTEFCISSTERQQWSRTKEIDRAIEHKGRFEFNPRRHTYQEA